MYLAVIPIFDCGIDDVVPYKSAKLCWLFTVYGMTGILHYD